jgi:YD repeat-containing protein
LWKWGVFLGLVYCLVLLIFWNRPPRPVKIELLPFTDSPLAWDGSHPYLTISLVPGALPPTFKNSVQLTPPTLHHGVPVNEFQVDLSTGRFVLRQTDFFVPDAMPLSLTRTYVTWGYHSKAFGIGGNHPYDFCPTGTRNPYTYMDLNLEDFQYVHMLRISKGTGYADAVFRHDETASEFYGAQVRWDGNGWILSMRDGSRVYFPESYNAKNCAQGAPTRILDGAGHQIELKRDKVRNLEELVSPSGHWIKFKYDAADRIVEAEDDSRNVRTYSYDRTGHVETVSDESGVLYRFEYAPLLREAGFDPWLLTAVMDRDWKVLLHNKYLWGRVSEQALADGEVYRLEYRMKGSEVLQTTVTIPGGKQEQFFFENGELTRRE